ncbi:MAG: helix-turn-helix domain-containing protein [Crocinitomicaceae bacterium]|nr:helix-turn-helix domain-containing protein [Crocinitomicaceae bacterium]
MKEERTAMQKEKKLELLNQLFSSFRHGLLVKKSESPRNFLASIGLDHYKIELGYNSGQFHHRKPDEFKKQYFELGVLYPSDVPTNAPDRTPYSTVGREGIIFPLREKENQIVNYASFRYKLHTPKWEHLNKEGVYPNYPNKNANVLFLCQNEIEAATLIQANILQSNQAVLSLRKGKLTEEIKRAISEIQNLKTIYVLGKTKAVQEAFENANYELKQISLPEETLNGTYTKHGIDSIREIVKDYATQHNTVSEGKAEEVKEEFKVVEEKGVKEEKAKNKFTIISEREFHYQGEELHYIIRGNIPKNPTLLDMQFEIESKSEGFLTVRFDLLDSASVEEKLFEWSEGTEINYAEAILEINQIRKELEKLRKIKNKGEKIPVKGFSVKQDLAARELLKEPELFKKLNTLIGESGIVGEDSTRLLLYLIASSYKFKYNLHAVIQTDDKEKGAELTQKIAALIPDIDRYNLDLTSARTFRYYGQTINKKLLVIPEYKGITESKAIKDLKRLQSKGIIVNDTPKKGSNGLLYTTKQEVKGHTSSIGACDKSKRYFENEPRTVLVGLDNSLDQEKRLMEYDCLLMAGMIDESAQNDAKELLQYVTANVQPLEVVNPFASKLMLPISIPNARALTMQLMNFVNIVTLFNQYQRKRDEKGRLITEPEDVRIAIDLFLDAIMVNIDEIDATTRDFFDRMKTLYKRQPKAEKTALSSLQIRQELNMSKTTTNRLLRTLVEYEYVKKDGYKNTGFQYIINHWNELEELKKTILTALGDPGEPNALGHQIP